MSILRALIRTPWKPRLRRPPLRLRPFRVLRVLAIPLIWLVLDQARRRRHHRSTDRAEQAAATEALYILATTPCNVCGRRVDPLEPHAIEIARQTRSRRLRRRAGPEAPSRTTVLCEDHMHEAG
jgi:hypothetical protein